MYLSSFVAFRISNSDLRDAFANEILIKTELVHISCQDISDNQSMELKPFYKILKALNKGSVISCEL